MRERALAAVGAATMVLGLGACSSQEVTPGDGEYAGRPQSAAPSAQATSHSSQAQEQVSPAQPTAGPYQDGTYQVSEAYGPVDDLVEEDSIDVTITLSQSVVTDVEVVGHALTDTSEEHLQRFVNEIDGAVVGRGIEEAHVQALAGASKTSQAFNDAVDAIAQQARQAAAPTP